MNRILCVFLAASATFLLAGCGSEVSDIPAGPQFGDGLYTVGVNIPAGAYETVDLIDPGSKCYWSIVGQGESYNAEPPIDFPTGQGLAEFAEDLFHQ